MLGPLAVWLARRDQSAFVEEHAREALNFNITVALAAIVCIVLMLVFVGFILGAALFIAWLVLTLIAAIRASEGEPLPLPDLAAAREIAEFPAFSARNGACLWYCIYSQYRHAPHDHRQAAVQGTGRPLEPAGTLRPAAARAGR